MVIANNAVDIGTLIVCTPGVVGGEPRISGTRISVRNIVTWTRMGWSPEEIIRHYTHLALAQVHAALTYYYANKDEMDKSIAADEAEEAQIVAEAASKTRS